MALSRNARRRLALYGGGALAAAVILAAPRVAVKSVPPLHLRRIDAKEALKHESTQLLRELIRVDTSDPPGVTRPAVELLARAFACEGIPYEIVGDHPERPLIVARLSGRSRAESLLLVNHLDVVPPGDLSKWSVPPFAAEMGRGQNANYLYGRGVLDMKGQTVASFFAMAQLKRSGIEPLRDIVFLGETGEETYRPQIGIGWVMTHRPDLLDGVTDVYNEGGVNEALGADIHRFGIEVLQKGALKYAIRAESKEAIEELRAFFKVKNDAAPYRFSPQTLEYLAFIGPSRSDVWGRLMVDPAKVVASEGFRKSAPDVYQNLVRDRLYCGAPEERKEGGWKTEVSFTLLPGSPMEEKAAELERWLTERRMTFELLLKTTECVPSPTSGRGWETLERVLSLDPTEKEASPTVGVWVLGGSYTTSSYARAHGLRAYGVSPFNVNFFDASKIHHPNERILLAYFVEGVERMSRIVREYATAP